MKKYFLVLLMALPCAACASDDKKETLERENLIEVSIPKRAYGSSDSPYFEAKLMLPMNPTTSEILVPKSFDQAAVYIRNGLDPVILEKMIAAYKAVCEKKPACNTGSAEFWDDYYSILENVTISDVFAGKKPYGMLDYIFSSFRRIGAVWKLDGDCSGDKSVCQEITDNVNSSYEIYGEIIFRKALLDEVKKPSSLCLIAKNMGDVVVLKGDCVSQTSASP